MYVCRYHHCSGVIMSAMASQITCVSIVCSIVCSGADQRKHQSSASLAFVRGIHWSFPSQKASNAEYISIWWRHHRLPSFAATFLNCSFIIKILFSANIRYNKPISSNGSRRRAVNRHSSPSKLCSSQIFLVSMIFNNENVTLGVMPVRMIYTRTLDFYDCCSWKFMENTIRIGNSCNRNPQPIKSEGLKLN